MRAIPISQPACIPSVPFRRDSLPTFLAFHSDESPARIPCVPFRRVARSIKVDGKIASSSLRLQHSYQQHGRRTSALGNYRGAMLACRLDIIYELDVTARRDCSPRIPNFGISGLKKMYFSVEFHDFSYKQACHKLQLLSSIPG